MTTGTPPFPNVQRLKLDKDRKPVTYRGLDDFVFFRRWYLVHDDGVPVALFGDKDEAQDFAALQRSDTVGVLRVPWLYRRRLGPLLDGMPAPPAPQGEGEEPS